ncbi:MAG: flagellar basal-body MS-ring/collar protein FliF [Rhodoblastus sp.]
MLGIQLQQIVNSLQSLGPRRLWQLAVAGVAIVVAVVVAGYFANRPASEVLYAGLDSQDVARIASALREANIAFDVTSDGGSLLVENGQASRARMILADRGLPRSPNAGYELFDKLGSLGLTSFMQDVTRIRALEGELARSIQTIRGVGAARVHIAMQTEGGFRKPKQASSASVIVRLSSAAERGVAQAIRRLVSAATAGLSMDAVTVLSADGSVLATGGDNDVSGASGALTLEKTISEALKDNIRQSLTPIVGVGNLQVSVALQLNTDKRQITETVYNPESRIERSVRVVKESQTAQNATGTPPTSIERNIPTDKAKGDGRGTNEENSKKEELTNYEISSKTTVTTVGEFSIERLNVAVLINKKPLLATLGEKAVEQLESRLSELSDLASTAVGLAKERGDKIKVTAIDFAEGVNDLSTAPEPGLATMAVRQIGSVFNALAVVVVAAIAGLVALRGLARTAVGSTHSQDRLATTEIPELAGPRSQEGDQEPGHSAIALGNNQRKRAQRRLESLVDADDQQAARVIKEWLRAEA